MSIFKRKAIIVKGHTFSEYLSRCGREYIMGRGEIIKDKNKLKPNRRYWEINGEYYQVGIKKELRIAFTAVSIAAMVMTVFLPIYFCVIAPMERYHDYNFKYWNDAPALNTLKEYVKNAVTPGNADYVPKEDRIATFDMDGTLFGERSPIYAEWMMYNQYYDYLKSKDPKDTKLTEGEDVPGKEPQQHTVVTADRVYDEIKKFMDTQVLKDFVVDNITITLEQAEAYLGAILFSKLTLEEYDTITNTFLEENAPKFNNLLMKDMFYKPMIEVVEFLQQNNFNVYVVSGTDRFMVRTIVNKHLNIPYHNVIGMDVRVTPSQGKIIRTTELLVKNVEVAKVELIMKEIGKIPVLSFGNSNGDVDMHNLILSNAKYKSQAYMVLADDNSREIGYTDDIIIPRREKWNQNGYQVFSMKDDWKTIYGDNVTVIPK
ncbi:MAG: hypothetical protein MJ208_00300 [Bacilli bacterium]|nr:hypothetical protein [Bacilli bacterium]